MRRSRTHLSIHACMMYLQTKASNEEELHMNQLFHQLEDPLLTIPEVARYLKISKSKLYSLVSKEEIPHLKIGRNVRIRHKDLQAWIEKQTNQLSIEVFSK
jgi:excisionase family DNA binding protein